MIHLPSEATLRRFGRFVAVGALQTGATYLLYLVLIRVLPYKLSFTIVFVTGVAMSYLLNSTVVFKVRTSFSSLLGFGLYSLVYYLLGLGMLTGLVEFLSVDARVAPLFVVATMIGINFLAMGRMFSFLARSSDR
jgi:putative flippase GtrA